MFFFKKHTTKTPVSSMTISQAFAAARKAGTQTGDTGLFSQWLEKTGLSSRGNVLIARMRQEYEAGFEERFTLAPPPTSKTLSQKLNLEYLERVKKEQKASVSVREYSAEKIAALYDSGKASTLKEAMGMI